MSKIGLHIVPGPRTGFGEFIRRTAGHLAVVKCVDDFGPALEVKELSPKTLTIGRIRNSHSLTNFDNAIDFRDAPEIAALNWYALAHPVWEAHREIDVWECLNEIDSHYEWQAEWYIALSKLAEADGFRLGLFSCSSGTPRRPEDGDMIPYGHIASCCMALQDKGHILSLHSYGGLPPAPTGLLRGSEPLHALRYRTLASYLLDLEIYMPVVITECGQNAGGQFIGVEQFIDDFAWYDSYAMRDPWVLGVCAWTLGGGEWAGANFSEALPALADYILAHPTDELPPPPPTKPRGAPRIQYDRTVNVIPGSATEETAIEIFKAGWRNGHQTTGGSYDDAGIGDLDKRRAVLWNIPAAERETYSRWYADNYPGVEVEYKDTAITPPPPPPPPAIPAIVGVHHRADGGQLRSADIEAIRRAHLTGYKFFQNDVLDFATIRGLGIPFDNCIKRLDHPIERHPIAWYVNGSTGIYDIPIREAITVGVTTFEVTNEPNLAAPDGGLGIMWATPGEFVGWCLALINAIKTIYPRARILAPAMSPQPGVSLWWDAMQTGGVFLRCDGIAAHAYWYDRATMNSGTHGRHYLGLFPYLKLGERIYITEASNNQAIDSDTEKGNQYRDYALSLEAQVSSVYYFCLSSSNVEDGAKFNSTRQTWVRPGWLTDRITEIPSIIGAR